MPRLRPTPSPKNGADPALPGVHGGPTFHGLWRRACPAVPQVPAAMDKRACFQPHAAHHTTSTPPQHESGGPGGWRLLLAVRSPTHSSSGLGTWTRPRACRLLARAVRWRTERNRRAAPRRRRPAWRSLRLVERIQVCAWLSCGVRVVHLPPASSPPCVPLNQDGWGGRILSWDRVPERGWGEGLWDCSLMPKACILCIGRSWMAKGVAGQGWPLYGGCRQGVLLTEHARAATRCGHEEPFHVCYTLVVAVDGDYID